VILSIIALTLSCFSLGIAVFFWFLEWKLNKIEEKVRKKTLSEFCEDMHQNYLEQESKSGN